MVKADAEIVTSAPRGAGVIETVRRILKTDLAEVALTIERQTVEIAHDLQGESVRLRPQCGGVLIAGASGGGKSTAATGLIENIVERGFQICVIDPEGDYADLEGALVLGDANSAPRLPEIVELLGKPEQNVVVNLLGVDVADRPRFLAELMPALSRLRVESARPHWLVIDEAHHLLPSAWNGASLILPHEFAAIILITVQPEHVAAEALQSIDYILALGGEADRVLTSFCKAVSEPAPEPIEQSIDRGQGLFWSRRSHNLRTVSTIHPRQERQVTAANMRRANSARTRASIFGVPRVLSTCGRRTWPFFYRLPKALMTGLGCTICAPATIRSGSEIKSKTANSPAMSRAPKETTH
jgi:hypothetical protein